MSFKSIDTFIDDNEAVNSITEILSSLDIPGILPHNLWLKIASHNILLSNFNETRSCQFDDQKDHWKC